jgi:hypothetical protein
MVGLLLPFTPQHRGTPRSYWWRWESEPPFCVDPSAVDAEVHSGAVVPSVAPVAPVAPVDRVAKGARVLNVSRV